MRLQVIVSTVRLGGAGHRVLRPAGRPGRAALFDTGRDAESFVDRPAAAVLAAAWALAGRSPRSMVYVPLRAWDRPPAPEWCAAAEDLDLVLLPSALQFPPSRWKELRARLGRGVPHTVTLPGTGLPDAEAVDRSQPWRHAGLRFTVAARTLFVTGRPYELQRAGHELPGLIHGRTDEHTCAEVFATGGDGPQRLHIELTGVARDT
ncbi:hypothetical protein [Dactylosporangium sp. CA-233914]|uniref:hypothetical protein n=1 Tax=Dactylosporangium sp. CA-233914 TaxID=3239934 RepID=UPI003D8D1644